MFDEVGKYGNWLVGRSIKNSRPMPGCTHGIQVPVLIKDGQFRMLSAKSAVLDLSSIHRDLIKPAA
jgi:hypothetical protein